MSQADFRWCLTTASCDAAKYPLFGEKRKSKPAAEMTWLTQQTFAAYEDN